MWYNPFSWWSSNTPVVPQPSPVVTPPTPSPVPIPVPPVPAPSPVPVPTPSPQSSLLTPDAQALILEFEVGGGESYYNRFLIHPELPGGSSTITIGVGVDLGYYSDAEFDTMWGGKLNQNDFDALKKAVGMSRSEAIGYFPSVKGISVPWSVALEVFVDYDVQKTYNQCVNAFPGFQQLAPNCQGAIISLVFNRGASVKSNPGTTNRVEMLNIKNLIPQKDYAGIAKQLRNMERLWRGTSIEDGMTRRREAEAALVETCIGT